MPGTTGSIAVTLLLALFLPLPKHLAAIFLVSIPLSVWALHSLRNTRLAEDHDPGWVVIDEWQGMAIAWLLAAPESLFESCLLFALFRGFDIAKIAPANVIDETLGGIWGVLADDWIAGVYAGAVFLLIKGYFPW